MQRVTYCQRSFAVIGSNAAEVIRAGADCLAVVSAICVAADPFDAAFELCRIAKKYALKRGN